MSARFSHRRRTAGFTLTEVLISAFLSTIVVAAIGALSIAALRTYYVESDYLEIGGQSRRLVDDLTEQGTFADDVAVFRDIDAAHRIPVTAGDRGDCLMLFERATDGTGEITSFVFYYLAYTSTTGSGARPISLWRFTAEATGSTPRTKFPTIALNNYPRAAAQRVSGDIFTGTLPRTTPITTTPITPRAGIFTNDGFVSGGSPTVLVNLPSRLTGRGNSTNKATSNITFAISPRR